MGRIVEIVVSSFAGLHRDACARSIPFPPTLTATTILNSTRSRRRTE
jgi:hypothetical protein